MVVPLLVEQAAGRRDSQPATGDPGGEAGWVLFARQL